jgi:hypothetical protein
MRTNVSKESITSIIMVENQPSKKPSCRWRYFPPKRRFIYGLHGAVSQTMAFVSTVVRTSNPTLVASFRTGRFICYHKHTVVYSHLLMLSYPRAIQEVRFHILFPLKGFPHSVCKLGWLLLLHDNSRPHSATATGKLLNFRGWEILPHLSYISGLALSDFFLLPKMRNLTKGLRFHSNEDVRN